MLRTNSKPTFLNVIFSIFGILILAILIGCDSTSNEESDRDKFLYQVRILDNRNSTPVKNATVALYLPGSPAITGYTDNMGVVAFNVDQQFEYKLVSLSIDKSGFQPWSQYVAPQANELPHDVRLTLPGVPTSTPEIQVSPTNTAVPDLPTAEEPPVIEEDTAVPTNTPTPILTETPIPTDTATPTPIPTNIVWTRPKDGQAMVHVAAGTFTMGANNSDQLAKYDEFPAHEVTLSEYWIDQTEVSNQQYSKCVETGQCRKAESAGNRANQANYPRVNVTWNDAMNYCEWVEGTLPTEAQWEYAAKGTERIVYPWGNNAPTCQLANYAQCPNETQSVGSHPSGTSWVGALDMAGNVYEWVFDWYDDDFYDSSPTNNPVRSTATSANVKVKRGGSYFHSPDHLRVTNRYSAQATNVSSNTGFRCVVNVSD